MTFKTVILCIVTMTAFAANSVLCRIALIESAISPYTFTAVRLMSGGLFLFPGLSAPPLLSATMMILSGVFWGAYSL